MSTPSSVFSEVAALTWKKQGKKVMDNVSNNNALLSRILKKNQVRVEDGGLTIVTPLDYAENNTYQRYSGWDLLNIGESDVITAAEYQWRQIAINIVANGLQIRQNSGSSRIAHLVKTRTKNAIRTFKNNFSSDIYSDGTLANQVNGLQALVADAGTGTVGGIDSSTWTFWQNTVQSAASPLQGGGAITPSSTTIQSLMLPLWLNLTRGDELPDLIVCDDTYFTYYEESLTANKRYTDDSEGQGGFTKLKYKSADVIYDGSAGFPASHMYFLNSDYYELVAHKDANMTVMEEASPVNQDGAVVPILWQGNLSCGNRSQQGVLKA